MLFVADYRYFYAIFGPQATGKTTMMERVDNGYRLKEGDMRPTTKYFTPTPITIPFYEKDFENISKIVYLGRVIPEFVEWMMRPGKNRKRDSKLEETCQLRNWKAEDDESRIELRDEPYVMIEFAGVDTAGQVADEQDVAQLAKYWKNRQNLALVAVFDRKENIEKLKSKTDLIKESMGEDYHRFPKLIIQTKNDLFPTVDERNQQELKDYVSNTPRKVEFVSISSKNTPRRRMIYNLLLPHIIQRYTQ